MPVVAFNLTVPAAQSVTITANKYTVTGTVTLDDDTVIDFNSDPQTIYFRTPMEAETEDTYFRDEVLRAVIAKVVEG